LRALVLGVSMAWAIFAGQTPVAPIDSGHGATGPYAVAVDTIRTSHARREPTLIYRPEGVGTRLPLVFFLHGLRTNKRGVYDHICQHLAGRGLCVAFPHYRLRSFPGPRRTYRKLFSRMAEIVEVLGERIDTTRMGFVGHSFGGAAIPAFSLRAISQLGWGRESAFLFIMAPHFVFGITEDELRHFPSHVKMIVEVYEDDDCNDHRMAKHLFETIAIGKDEKVFVTVLSDTSEPLGYAQVADHAVPYGPGDALGEIDGLDYYAIYRPLDAVAEYALNGDAQARAVALGESDTGPRFMGYWRDGRRVKEALVSDHPEMLKPMSQYFFSWKHPWNPHNPERRRRRFLFKW